MNGSSDRLLLGNRGPFSRRRENGCDKEAYAIIGAAMAEHCDYLKTSGLQRGLLINLGSKKLQHKRLVHNLRKSASSVDNKGLGS